VVKSHFWPQSVVWETTLRCNMRCLHCGSVAGDARPDELSTAEALDLCDQLAALDTETVILSGGETLLRDDWPQITERLIDHGILVGLITNGVVLDKDRKVLAELLRLYDGSRGGISLGISLDGLDQAHDEIRGIPGSFQQVLRCLKLTADNGLPAVVLTTVNGRNVADLRPLRDLIFELAPYAWQFQTCSVYGRMKERRDWLLTREQYIDLVQFLAENRRLRKENPRTDPADCIGYHGEFEADLRSEPWHGCHAGIRGIGIESNGNIKGCLSLLDPIFVEDNIRQHSLAEIWDRPGAFAYNREFEVSKLEGMCAGCEHGKACAAGCRGVAHSVTGSFYQAPFCMHGFGRQK